MGRPILFSWSGGKESAMALHEVRRDHEVAALVTTVTEGYERISMHGVRRELLRMQAEALGLSLHEIRIPKRATNEEYEAAMRECMEMFQAEGIDAVAFGDLFLEDIREYRERNLARIGMKALFPIWMRDTTELAGTFIDLGFKAILCCVDPKVLFPEFVGREFDADLLGDLPAGVDPCGENGEFHTFVYAGPGFTRNVAVRAGERVEREGFWFCDLLPADEGGS